jgi:sterol 3beta-glucosyltransferase
LRVICPFFGDQPFWGRRVAMLGAGPRPIPQRRLAADSLSAAIHTAVNETQMRERAAALGRAIRAEDGVGQAVAQIEAYITRPAGQIS